MNPDNFKNSWAVILAGGSGTRFWPKSLKKKPKQLWALGGGTKTMLELTLDRLDPIIPPEKRIIVTNVEQMDLTRQIAHKSCDHFIPEPVGRNTAAALALAAMEIQYHSKEEEVPTMLSFHADHIIPDKEAFLHSLEQAVLTSKENYLTLVGIKPRGPETAFGYIKAGNPLKGPELKSSFLVDSFYEKPNKQKAEEYLDTGSYYWNSGLFIWKNQVFLEEIKEKLPDTFKKLNHFYETMRNSKACFNTHEFTELYKSLEDISVDHAILEKSDQIAVTASSMSWLDIGSWDALPKVFPKDENGNFISGDSFLLDTKNCVIDSKDQFIATIGLEDLVIVTTERSVLVCHKNRAQDVKQVVAYLKAQEKSELI